MKSVEIAACLVLCLPALAASFVNEPSVYRKIYSCNGTIVEMLITGEASSMGADGPQDVVTFNVENPPKKFTLTAHLDHEGPLYWHIDLNGEACDRTLN